ncbi:hypothetical protein CC1G_15472 [Coprinopsis cinerea okayama7|uniref:Uncharacterized protein n=1 Tax=Coprinopsis cinerea (strain Okayama-7 / 130 / ATCC MYA-4618 / FGSC 9003) TaxID=240176 RepID=D6RQV6_COPC7|nr:hypothetical protein CC1G_15472 [Coprinopsis cinerea okayama7\|eukprot:XP_002910195.1 hypothetical protein CC1G_15472 [Coprinopsis cinerea okayama7\
MKYLSLLAFASLLGVSAKPIETRSPDIPPPDVTIIPLPTQPPVITSLPTLTKVPPPKPTTSICSIACPIACPSGWTFICPCTCQPPKITIDPPRPTYTAVNPN